MELLRWLLWFGVVPWLGLLVFGWLVFHWLDGILLTRRRVWLVTLMLSGAFMVVAYALVYKFSYIVE